MTCEDDDEKNGAGVVEKAAPAPLPQARGLDDDLLSRPGRSVRGRIDAVYPRSPAGWHVVDWKTGAPLPAGDPAEGLQMDLYGLAAVEAFAVPPGEVDLSVVYLLTQGGPGNASKILPVLAYQIGIQAGNLGRGAAIALFLVPLLLPALFLVLRNLKRREY